MHDKKPVEKYKEEQAKEFEENLPMPRELFFDLFDYLNEQSEHAECKHNFDMTKTFLKEKNLLDGKKIDCEAVLEWCMENGAGCDCEIVFNIEEQFED